jgi:uncharacterized repeat protein (TIGR03847 family)
MSSYEVTNVDQFLATAVGIPGARTFFFHVTSGKSHLFFKCEKQQVEALTTALTALLGDMPPVSAAPISAASGPAAPEWTVGAIALGVETEDERIVVVLEEMTAETDEGSTARFGVSLPQAKAFIETGTALLSNGRPGCVLCGSPIDSLGYQCHCFN